MRHSRVLALLCAGALLVAAGSDQDAREDVSDPLFWAEQARWLRNGGNFRSSDRCERAQRRLSGDRDMLAGGGADGKRGANGRVTVAVLWAVGDHAVLLDVVGGLLARCDWDAPAHGQPRDGPGALRVAVFVPVGAPRELLAELSLWRAVEMIRVPLDDHVLAAPHGSLQQRLRLLRACIALFGSGRDSLSIVLDASRAPRLPEEGTCEDTLGRAAELLRLEGFLLPAPAPWDEDGGVGAGCSEKLFGARGMEDVDRELVPRMQ
ncbi:hypothetical protein T484DRAFT_1885972, partial [Baffinella frigidus]